MRFLIGTLAFVMLAGCGSSPVSSDRADPVPAKRLYAFGGPAAAQLIVIRDGGLYGAGCNYRFCIDGTLAAEFAAGEVARFGLPAGRHILSSTYSGACGGGSVVEREIEVKVGEIVRRRISVITGGAQDISPTAF